MPLPFKKLRDTMFCADPRIYQTDLAAALKCSINHMNRLMNKNADWTMSEMYAALMAVGAKPEQLHEFFSREDLPNERN